MKVFDNILETLSDGEKHAFEEIKLATRAHVNETQLKTVLHFLQSYGFVQLTCVGGEEISAKLDHSMLRFLKQIKKAQ